MSESTQDIDAVPLESPEDWVTQDRVPFRPELDERRWITNDDELVIDDWGQPSGSLSQMHGDLLHINPTERLELRCRRKHLPPIACTSRTLSGIEALVCADIAERQKLGIAKYGTTVADNPLTLRDWLNHAYQECLDQAIYLRRAMEELD